MSENSNKNSNLGAMLDAGIRQLLQAALKITGKSVKETRFLFRFLVTSRRQANRRKKQLKKWGRSIPPFLIASITPDCNLSCAGCYACKNNKINKPQGKMLTAGEWEAFFCEAARFGVLFVLLAGGEPFLRPDILQAAARQRSLLFPIFTNATLINNETVKMLHKNRNLLPILSLEGGEKETDTRRGKGVYAAVTMAMQKLVEKHLLFGVSLTVTSLNWQQLLSNAFIKEQAAKGCRVFFYVEYVPADNDPEKTLSAGEQVLFLQQLEKRRQDNPGLLLISFPGDEAVMGGCLAAGRGFFHINAFGQAEACPFIPYSDTNIKSGFAKVLASPFFSRLREANLQNNPHVGGCALYSQEQHIKALLAQNKKTGGPDKL